MMQARKAMNNSVTVIIPTTCEPHRSQQLLRAIDSVLAQAGGSPHVLVVVNGARYDADLLSKLRLRSDIRVDYREVGNLPLALAYGRSQVESEFFCFLDDDDELLSESLSIRLGALVDPEVDVAVSNGYNVAGERRTIRVQTPFGSEDNPLEALVRENWLASCGGLFRTRAVPQEIFDELLKFYEWTTVAFRVSLGLKVVFVDMPGYVVNDSPSSLSKSEEFLLCDEKMIRQMLSHSLPRPVKNQLRKKLSQSLHNSSSYFLEIGDLNGAWRYHLGSLFMPGGIKFILYTRKLIFPKLFAC